MFKKLRDEQYEKYHQSILSYFDEFISLVEVISQIDCDNNKPDRVINHNHVHSFIGKRMEEVKAAKSEKQALSQFDCVFNFFKSNLLICQLSNPIEFEEINNPEWKNIVIFGTTGSGKSSLLNKMKVAIDGGDKYIKAFEASKSNNGVTKKVTYLEA